MSTELLQHLKSNLKQLKDKAKQCQGSLDDQRAILEWELNSNEEVPDVEFLRLLIESIKRYEKRLETIHNTIIYLNLNIFKLEHGLIKEPEVNLNIEFQFE